MGAPLQNVTSNVRPSLASRHTDSTSLKSAKKDCKRVIKCTRLWCVFRVTHGMGWDCVCVTCV